MLVFISTTCVVLIAVGSELCSEVGTDFGLSCVCSIPEEKPPTHKGNLSFSEDFFSEEFLPVAVMK